MNKQERVLTEEVVDEGLIIATAIETARVNVGLLFNDHGDLFQGLGRTGQGLQKAVRALTELEVGRFMRENGPWFFLDEPSCEHVPSFGRIYHGLFQAFYAPEGRGLRFSSFSQLEEYVNCGLVRFGKGTWTKRVGDGWMALAYALGRGTKAVCFGDLAAWNADLVGVDSGLGCGGLCSEGVMIGAWMGAKEEMERAMEAVDRAAFALGRERAEVKTEFESLMDLVRGGL
jgi:hypothetical protein